MSIFLRAAVIGAAALLAGCTTRVPPALPSTPPVPVTVEPVVPPVTPPPPTTALGAGVRLVQPAALSPTQAVRALEAFRLSCPVLVKRTDASGLTRGADPTSVTEVLNRFAITWRLELS